MTPVEVERRLMTVIRRSGVWREPTVDMPNALAKSKMATIGFAIPKADAQDVETNVRTREG